MTEYRPIVSKFGKIPSLPDLDMRTSEYVYFVESDTEFKLIKIGRTESLKRRLMVLQSACPVQLRLIAAIRAPSGTEQLFHKILQESRTHGEWFLPSASVIGLAKALPKMGTLTHAQVRNIGESQGLSELQVTQFFVRSDRSKRSRQQFRHRQLVFR
jgi:hypothetical protein